MEDYLWKMYDRRCKMINPNFNPLMVFPFFKLICGERDIFRLFFMTLRLIAY